MTVPAFAMGGEKGLGAKVGETIRLVAAHVESSVEPNCGHVLPEEAFATIVQRVLASLGRPYN